MRQQFCSAVALASAILASTVLAAGPAAARPELVQDGDTWREAVSYADLDLNSPAGQAALSARIQRAAERVCGPRPDHREWRAKAAFGRCMDDSVKSAVAAIPAASRLASAAR